MSFIADPIFMQLPREADRLSRQVATIEPRSGAGGVPAAKMRYRTRRAASMRAERVSSGANSKVMASRSSTGSDVAA